MRRFSLAGLIIFTTLQLNICGAVSNDTLKVPHPAHAHNDYLHARPLFDALENGFRSIEADVFTLGDSLYVAHDRKDIKPGRTLRALYLEILMDYFSDHDKTIYDNTTPLILLIDIKGHGLTTYKLLDRILYESREILCKVSNEAYVCGSVMVVISGKERDAVWTELVEAGVDLINTDDLVGLRAFLSARGDE